MSQHDYSLDNAAGAAFRADLNNALGAIVTLNSGASEPATMFARMLWADTTSNLLKQRNAANSGWLVRGTLAETLGVSRSSDTILAAADYGKYFLASSSFTQTLTAVATLGDGWFCRYRVAAGVTIVFDPNSTEQIDGAATKTVVGPASGVIFCTGAAFFTYGFDGPAASATVAGRVELATDAEVLTGTDTARAVTPAGLRSVSGLVKLASGSVSAAATLDIPMTAYTAFRNKLLVLTSFLPATDSVALQAQFSTNGGSSYDAGGTDYGFAFRTLNSAGATGDSVGAAAHAPLSTAFIGNAAGEGIDCAIVLYDTISAVPTRCTFQSAYSDLSGNFTHNAGMAGRAAAQDTDAVRIKFSSGNIASGEWALYGYN